LNGFFSTVAHGVCDFYFIYFPDLLASNTRGLRRADENRAD
jgi:hypothetical protein